MIRELHKIKWGDRFDFSFALMLLFLKTFGPLELMKVQSGQHGRPDLWPLTSDPCWASCGLFWQVTSLHQLRLAAASPTRHRFNSFTSCRKWPNGETSTPPSAFGFSRVHPEASRLGETLLLLRNKGQRRKTSESFHPVCGLAWPLTWTLIVSRGRFLTTTSDEVTWRPYRELPVDINTTGGWPLTFPHNTHLDLHMEY